MLSENEGGSYQLTLSLVLPSGLQRVLLFRTRLRFSHSQSDGNSLARLARCGGGISRGGAVRDVCVVICQYLIVVRKFASVLEGVAVSIFLRFLIG